MQLSSAIPNQAQLTQMAAWILMLQNADIDKAWKLVYRMAANELTWSITKRRLPK